MRIFFSVGEPSGDQHAAHLIEELRRQVPSFEAVGFGGPLMERAGCRLVYRMTDLAIMGIFSVLPMLWTFWWLHRQAKRELEASRPEAVLLVDFPGFNWHIARLAKKRGIPVFYYMPPQLWAWAPWRIKKVHKYVDHVLSGLTFERDWYVEHGVDAAFVGHPFFDEVADHPLEVGFVEERRAGGRRIVGILPGSRGHEISRNGPALVEIIGQLRKRHPEVLCLVACYRELHRTMLRRLARERGLDLEQGAGVEFHLGKTPEVVEAADCCLMVSGSVSLELLGRRKPAAVIYKGGPLAASLARWVLTCRFISLPNLLAGRMVMPEFFYSGSDAPIIARLVRILDNWLANPTALSAKQREMAELADRTAQRGGTRHAAEAILTRLGEQPEPQRRAA